MEAQAVDLEYAALLADIKYTGQFSVLIVALTTKFKFLYMWMSYSGFVQKLSTNLQNLIRPSNRFNV